MARPSWETKDDPEFADLIEAMLHDERQQFYALGSVSEREEFLAKIEERWRRYREAAKNRPPSDDSSIDPQPYFDDIRSGLLELQRRLQTGELVDTTTTPIPTKTASPKPGNAIGWLAVGFAMLERGLDVIGYHNLIVGAGLFVGAFICFCVWFVRTEKARRWHIGLRAIIVCIAALIYFSVFGRQLYRQYRAESVSSPISTTGAPSLKAQPTQSANEGKTFADVDVTYFATLYRKYNSAQADQAAQSYIGQWIKVTGTVGDVVREPPFAGSSDTIRMTIVIPTTDNLRLYAVLANFDQPRWMNRARILGREEKVTVIGKINHATDMGLTLDECEIVE